MIYIVHYSNYSVVTYKGKKFSVSRSFSLKRYGDSYKTLAEHYYARLGLALGQFYPIEKENDFFVRRSEFSEKGNDVYWLMRYEADKTKLFCRLVGVKRYSNKKAEVQALQDLAVFSRIKRGQTYST